MNICIVAANLPPAYSGGGLQAIQLAKEFRAQGHGVALIGRLFRDRDNPDSIDGIPVTRVRHSSDEGPGVLPGVRQVFRFASALWRLRKGYDCVLFFNPDGGFPQSWAVVPLLHLIGKRTATRMTLLGSSDPQALARRRWGTLRVLPYQLHDRVISISSALARSYASTFGSDGRLSNITNGVDLGRYNPYPGDKRDLRLRLGLDPALKYAVTVGRISHRKGIDVLVQAWKYVIRECPDARVLLVGPTGDPDRNVEEAAFLRELTEEMQQSGLSPFFHWIGRANNVVQYLHAADLFVFSSRREGCPNALLEAMACGLPIVTARIDGITDDLVTHERDGLVTELDPQKYAASVIRVLKSPTLAASLGSAALERSKTQFDIRVVARRYLDVLETM